MVACSFRLRTTPRFIRHRRRFGFVPPGPQFAMQLTTKTKLFPRVGFMSPGKFLGKRKRKNGWWRKLAFSPGHFSFSTVRFAHRRPAHSAGRPGTVIGDIVSSCDSCIYGDKAAFFGSFLGYKKEHPVTVFLPPAAFTATKLPSLVLSRAAEKVRPRSSPPPTNFSFMLIPLNV